MKADIIRQAVEETNMMVATTDHDDHRAVLLRHLEMLLELETKHWNPRPWWKFWGKKKK